MTICALDAKKGWENFTDSVIAAVDKYGGADLVKGGSGTGRGVVFLAWGAWAGKRVDKLDKVRSALRSIELSPDTNSLCRRSI